MRVFLFVVIAHFVEHLAQLFELFIFGWDRPDCLGFLGLWQPGLMRSEWLHYLYALSMLIGLYWLRKQVNNHWWTRTIHLQHYHHIEHLLLLVQAMLGLKATGIGGIWFPRIELHFFYNLVVMIPMMLAHFDNRKKLKGVSV
jgi:hypothetical protein